MVVTVNHAVSHGLRLSLFILPFAIMVVPDTLSRPGGNVMVRPLASGSQTRGQWPHRLPSDRPHISELHILVFAGDWV